MVGRVELVLLVSEDKVDLGRVEVEASDRPVVARGDQAVRVEFANRHTVHRT